MSDTTISDEELRGLLKEQIQAAGGMVAWAQARGFAHTEVSLFLSADRNPGKRTLKALGYRRVHRYIKEPRDGEQDRDGSREAAQDC